MEKKTSQRIIGILVAIALVVILLPLFFGGSDETPTQTAATKPQTPPTEQTTNKPAEVAMEAHHDELVAPANPVPATPAKPKAAASVLAEKNAVNKKSQPTKPLVAETKVINQQDKIVKPKTPVANLENKVAAKSVEEKPVVIPPQNETNASAEEVDIEADNVSVKPTPAVTKQPVKATATKTNADTLSANLKSASWVVQLGSFKVKSNATRLADKLRNQGYKAFMKEFKSAKGESTRVYVGPAFKHNEALALADKLKKTTDIQGIVLNYNPLKL